MPLFDEGVARSLVDIALERGIDAFDTGPNYSQANAEPRLGRILGSRVNDVFLATKVGTRLINGKHVKGYTRAEMTQSFEQSLRLLGRDHVDLLQFHGMPDPLTNEAMDFLLEQKQKGRTRLVGTSTSVEGGRQALAAGGFDVLMIEYNVIHRHEEKQLTEDAAKVGVGILVKSPLAQTLYSNRIWKVRSLSDFWYLARALKNMRHKIIKGRKYRFLTENGPGHDLALQFVLDNKDVTAAIIGTTRPHNLLANIQAAQQPLPPDIRRRILAA